MLDQQKRAGSSSSGGHKKSMENANIQQNALQIGSLQSQMKPGGNNPSSYEKLKKKLNY